MKYLSVAFFMALGFLAHGQNITGKWRTFDDKTQEKKAIIEIYKDRDLYFARIVESFVGQESTLCETCKGTRKGKPIIGLIIIEDLKKDGDAFTGGTILDPENGEVYKCHLKLMDNGTLKVRGYLGLPLFGRTQYWMRKI